MIKKPVRSRGLFLLYHYCDYEKYFGIVRLKIWYVFFNESGNFMVKNIVIMIVFLQASFFLPSTKKAFSIFVAAQTLIIMHEKRFDTNKIARDDTSFVRHCKDFRFHSIFNSSEPDKLVASKKNILEDLLGRELFEALCDYLNKDEIDFGYLKSVLSYSDILAYQAIANGLIAGSKMSLHDKVGLLFDAFLGEKFQRYLLFAGNNSQRFLLHKAHSLVIRNKQALSTSEIFESDTNFVKHCKELRVVSSRDSLQELKKAILEDLLGKVKFKDLVCVDEQVIQDIKGSDFYYLESILSYQDCKAYKGIVDYMLPKWGFDDYDKAAFVFQVLLGDDFVNFLFSLDYEIFEESDLVILQQANCAASRLLAL